MSMLFCPRCANLLPLHNIEGQLVLQCNTCPFQFRVEKKMESRTLGAKKDAAEIEGQTQEGQLDTTGALPGPLLSILSLLVLVNIRAIAILYDYQRVFLNLWAFLARWCLQMFARVRDYLSSRLIGGGPLSFPTVVFAFHYN